MAIAADIPQKNIIAPKPFPAWKMQLFYSKHLHNPSSPPPPRMEKLCVFWKFSQITPTLKKNHVPLASSPLHTSF